MKDCLNKLATGNILCSVVMMVMSLLMLSSCAENDAETMAVNSKSNLSLNISMEKWNVAGQTRASYSAMSESSGNKVFNMSFTSGDAIGLFVCDKDGKVVVANRKWTYSGSAWTADTPIEYVTGMGSYTYFAYYPWVSSLSGAPALDSTPDISSAEAFFASAIAAWTLAADQSTVDAFTGSDLMVAKGTAVMPLFHEVQVSFTMAHQMGLAVTQPDFTFYDINDPSYTWTVTQEFTGNIPYQIGSNYYYLVKPGVETTIGAKSTTLAARQVEQLFFTNMEPGRVEYDGEKRIICLDNIKLGSSPTYTYSVSTDNGSTFGSYTSTKPSWLTVTANVVDGKTTEFSASVTSTKTTSITKGSFSNQAVFENPHNATLKAASPVSNVDLSMVNNDGTARASRTTANCYLVHAPGTYKLPLVYGNAIKNGDETSTSSFYTARTSNTLQRLQNHTGEGITTPWIKTQIGSCPDGARLIWQDVNGLISSVGIDSSDNGYLTFTVDEDNIAEGNAVIAATLSGTVVWSWHIWVTTETLNNTTVVATGSHNYTVAPVNVGQVNTVVGSGTRYAGSMCRVRATANNVTLEFEVTQPDYLEMSTVTPYPSPYYQWGRKDAMMPATGAYNATGTAIASYNSSDGTYATSASISTNIQNPDKWYNVTNKPHSGNARNYWDMNMAWTDNISTATVKTVYDPCPPGFCVPTGNLWNYLGNNGNRTMSTWDATYRTATWNINITGDPLVFPASGLRYGSSGSLRDVGSRGYCWSASCNSSNPNFARYLGFYSNYWSWFSDARSYGCPVRAVAEE